MGNPRRDPQSLAQAEGGAPLVNSVVRAFSILRCFEHGRGHGDGRYLGNQDIARRTRLPKATVSRLTQTLAALGYLEYSPSLEKYALGPAVLGLGHAYMAGHDVIDIAQPLMQELADYTQAAVMLAVPEGLRMLLLEVCQGDAMFNLRLEKGSRVPHGTTALGRADLAARPREVFEQRLAEDPRRHRARAQGLRDLWLRVLARRLEPRRVRGRRADGLGRRHPPLRLQHQRPPVGDDARKAGTGLRPPAGRSAQPRVRVHRGTFLATGEETAT